IAASLRSGVDTRALSVARTIWIVGIVAMIILRVVRFDKRIGPKVAFAALLTVGIYWGGLAMAHHPAYARTATAANELPSARGETVVRLAAMPMLATPFRWQSVAETDRALYRFTIELNNNSTEQFANAASRFEKPTGPEAQLVSLAERDRRAQTLLGFARFPLAKAEDVNCIGQTLVQFA